MPSGLYSASAMVGSSPPSFAQVHWWVGREFKSVAWDEDGNGERIISKKILWQSSCFICVFAGDPQQIFRNHHRHVNVDAHVRQ